MKSIIFYSVLGISLLIHQVSRGEEGSQGSQSQANRYESAAIRALKEEIKAAKAQLKEATDREKAIEGEFNERKWGKITHDEKNEKRILASPAKKEDRNPLISIEKADSGSKEERVVALADYEAAMRYFNKWLNRNSNYEVSEYDQMESLLKDQDDSVRDRERAKITRLYHKIEYSLLGQKVIYLKAYLRQKEEELSRKQAEPVTAEEAVESVMDGNAAVGSSLGAPSVLGRSPASTTVKLKPILKSGSGSGTASEPEASPVSESPKR